MNHINFSSRDLATMFDAEIIGNHIGYARENITNLENYITAAHERRDYLKSLTFIPVVELYRYKYSSSPVFYNVSLYHYPDIPDGQSHKIYSGGFSKKFGGRERKHAIEYATELSDKFKCHIVGNVIPESPCR